MQIKLLVEGGNMQAGPTLGQKLGPTGIGMNIVIQKVNEATKDFKGLKVPVELEIDPSTKKIEVKVFSPPIAELIKKELGIQKGSGLQKQMPVGNISIEQVIAIAKSKMQNLLAKDLRAAVKLTVGTCGSVGVLIENKTAKEIQEEIDKGIYDYQIKNEIIETPEEKKKKLKQFYDKLQKDIEKLKKQLEAEKAQAQEKETKK